MLSATRPLTFFGDLMCILERVPTDLNSSVAAIRRRASLGEQLTLGAIGYVDGTTTRWDFATGSQYTGPCLSGPPFNKGALTDVTVQLERKRGWDRLLVHDRHKCVSARTAQEPLLRLLAYDPGARKWYLTCGGAGNCHWCTDEAYVRKERKYWWGRAPQLV